jgi:hypothetical protein
MAYLNCASHTAFLFVARWIASLRSQMTVSILLVSWLFENLIKNSKNKLRVVPDKRSAIRDP